MTLIEREGCKSRPHAAFRGTQLLFKLPNGFTVSFVNPKELHSYEFAWEAALLDSDGCISYNTPLTQDVEVFFNDADAEAFLDLAIAWAVEDAE